MSKLDFAGIPFEETPLKLLDLRVFQLVHLVAECGIADIACNPRRLGLEKVISGNYA